MRARLRAAAGPALLLLAALPLSLAAAGDGTLPGDQALARAVQAVSFPGAAELARLVNWLGAAPAAAVITVALAAGLAILRRYPEALLVLATLPARALNALLKAAAGSPRPTEDLVRVTEHVDGLGFPSGHAMGAVLLYGAVFYLAGRLVPPGRARAAVRAGAAAAVALAGLARIYTGAHWPSDVLGGYLWGAAVLWLLVAAYRAAPAALRRRHGGP
ncbi:MAG TPA: phosphatase PAP2 family protein [Dehalococcoidia bacterium]